MTKYNPDVMQEFADNLYDYAARIVWKYCVIGVLLGGIAVGLGTELLNRTLNREIDNPWWGGSVIAGVIGYQIGKGKAFQLRLEAQRTMCQMQVEYNTRKAV